jgi:hypothetical protein
MTLNGSSGLVFPDASSQTTAATGFGFKNRIINGAMVIDQRNAGASVTPADSQYTLDRWQARLTQSSKFSVQQSLTAPVGFSNSLKITSLSAYSVLAGDFFFVNQQIEGYNAADLGWGTANAKTVTLSFWVQSSLTGTFGGVIRNGSGASYSYPFTYSISSANTWTQISVTIAGPTSTWAASTTNGSAIEVDFALGVGSTFSTTAGAWASGTYLSATGATSVVGTNGATFYITGVQLEKGSTATSFDYRPYGTELALCQRYYEKLLGDGASGAYAAFGTGYSSSATTSGPIYVRFYPKRATPTCSVGGTQRVLSGSSVGLSVTASDAYVSATGNGYINISWTTSITAGNATMLTANNDSSAYVAASAEL